MALPLLRSRPGRPTPPMLVAAALLLALVRRPASAAAALPLITMNDNVEAGEVVGNVFTILGISSGAAVSILHSDEEIVNSLAVNASSGALYARTKIDRDSLCRGRRGRGGSCCAEGGSCELEAKVKLQLAGGGHRLLPLLLQLRDDNDNAPTFAKAAITKRVPETSATDYRSKKVTDDWFTAEDPDQGRNSVQQYRLISVDGDEAFRLDDSDPRRLALVPTRQLDRETRDAYQLRLLAVDGGSPKLTGTLSVTVSIMDVNDNHPVFEQAEYQAEIRETAEPNTKVAEVLATDKDAGKNGDVQYRLGQDKLGRFRVVRAPDGRGIVTLKKPIDADSLAGGHVEVYVTATDRGSPALSAEAKLTVRVVDVNDEPPRIKVTYISERQGVGSVEEEDEEMQRVALVSVSDVDSGTSVDCRAQDAGGSFQLSPLPPGRVAGRRDFELRPVRRFDREREASVRVAVVCADSGHGRRLSSTAVLRLLVQDVNDNPPAFEQTFAFSLPENLPPPGAAAYRLGFVRAVDPDDGGKAAVEYQLADDCGGAFRVSAGGELFATKPFDREQLLREDAHRPGAVAVVSPVVVATDAGGRHSATATVRVAVTNVNDNAPRFTQSRYAFAVAENREGSSRLGRVAARDSDGEQEFDFRLADTADKDVADSFFVDRHSGGVFASRPLDRERRASFEFLVLAVDNKRRGEAATRHTGTATVSVDVLDVNDCSPRILAPADGFVFAIPADAPAGHQVAVVSAEDDDDGANGEVTFSLEHPGDAAGAFDIDAASGTLFVSSHLHGEREYQLAVRATDAGSPPRSSTIRLLVRASQRLPSGPDGRQQGAGTAWASDHTKATLVLGLVVFFFLLLALAAFAAFALLRPCRRARPEQQDAWQAKAGTLRPDDTAPLEQHYHLIASPRQQVGDVEFGCGDTQMAVVHGGSKSSKAVGGEYQTLRMGGSGGKEAAAAAAAAAGGDGSSHSYYQIGTLQQLHRSASAGVGSRAPPFASPDLGDASASTAASVATPTIRRKFGPFNPYAGASFV